MAAEDQPILLSDLPPSRSQQGLALAIGAALLAAFAVSAPFFQLRLGEIHSFIPVVDALLFVSDVITAALLLSQSAVLGSRAQLVLADGYLFTGLLIVSHALTFPGAFSPTGLLGAGLQSTVYLYIVWHFGLPCTATAYAILKDRERDTPARGLARKTIAANIVFIAALVVLLTWMVTAGSALLPPIMIDPLQTNRVWFINAPVIVGLDVMAIAVVWSRRRSVLDLWLTLVLWAWFLETLLLSLTTYRYSLVWYVGRICGLLSAVFVLLALLSQTMTLATRLARSMMAQRRERETRLIAVDATLAVVAHEISQPLSTIAINAGAALRTLSRPEFDAAKLSEMVSDIASESQRAGAVIGGIRALFKTGGSHRGAVDLSELVAEALALLRGEIEYHGIAVESSLPASPPPIAGNRVQLRQVVLNLLTNAIEAMAPVRAQSRKLRVSVEQNDSKIVVKVQDSGLGIDPEIGDRIFEPFFTTKTTGMGLGLSICRTIVETHGGRLWASPSAPSGTIVQFTLPIDESAEA